MTRNLIFSLTLLLPLVLGVPDSAPAGTIPPVARPNVLLIILDDAAPLLSSYGGPVHTPHMDALAARGRRYSLAFANSTGCNPSRVSFATGLLPLCVDTMSQTDWRTVMDGCTPGQGTNVKTMFQVFAGAGYYTFAAGKIMHTAEQQAPEFEHSIWTPLEALQDRAANVPLRGWDVGTALLRDWGAIEELRGPNGETFNDADHPDWIIVDNTLAMLADAPGPWFAAVGLVSPHFPRYLPQRLIDQYRGVPLPDVLLNDLDDVPLAGLKMNNAFQRRAAQEILGDLATWRHFVATYYASLEFADEQVGRLLAAVPEDTIVVVWSDHGYHLGQKVRIEKGALWRESYHVPLIIAGPGVQPGVVDSVTNSTEVYPLLLDLAGLSATDGIDRTPIADGFIAFDGHVAIDDGAYALILYNAANGLKKQAEFYNVQSDPLQWRNLGGVEPSVEYRQRLQGYLTGN